MKYCENCNIVFDYEDICPNCGSKSLKEPTGQDFCFLCEIYSESKEYYENLLSSYNIPCGFIPSGTGMRSNVGLPLENLKVYIPYSFYDKASYLINQMAEDIADELRKKLLDNVDEIFIETEKAYKKFRKKLKLDKDADVVGVIRDRILNASKIVDGGKIGLADDGRYLFVYGKNPKERIITVNSSTFEIIAID